MENLDRRKFVIGIIIVIICLIYLLRLFFLQVVDTTYRLSAENNSRRHVTQYPARGLIYDRNGKLLVFNEVAYDIRVIPRQVTSFDTAAFCEIFNISKQQLQKALSKATIYSRYKPSTILKQISSKKYAVFKELIYKFPGFYVQTRTLRKYPKPIAAHVLGYVSEVDPGIIEKDNYYVSGDYIGYSGIEKSYEEYLRGKKGVKIYLVDVHNRIQGSYKDGKYDSIPVVGQNIITSLDADLQEYGELLMQNKKGSIVAIEPATGEILALVSTPAYNPNLLVGRARSHNYKILSRQTDNPLFNRALMAKYPPGSTFKVVNALIGLQEEVITTNSVFSCHGGYRVGSFHLGCHHNGSIDFTYSIQGSCNAYYCNVYRRILDDKKFPSIADAYMNWRSHLQSFGLGRKLGSDLAYEMEGFIPTDKYFDRFYGEGRWKSLMLVSMAIGQGELGLTPFQMANLTAAVANRGYYYIPHIVKSIEGESDIASRFKEKQYTSIDRKYFEPVINGMELVVQSGTATRARVKGISICGKTGTAENPHGKDHSIFIAFAPRDEPKIALSVYVENAGFGSTWAAPIASLMIEKYLRDTITRSYLEKYILDANLLIDKEKEQTNENR